MFSNVVSVVLFSDPHPRDWCDVSNIREAPVGTIKWSV